MDRFVSFTADMQYDCAIEAIDSAFEALSISGGSVIVPTNEYDRLRDSGILTKVDEIRREAKELKKAYRSGNDPVGVKKRAGELIQLLTDLKKDVNNIPSDPASEKLATKILYTAILAIMAVMTTIMVVTSVKAKHQFAEFGKMANDAMNDFGADLNFFANPRFVNAGSKQAGIAGGIAALTSGGAAAALSRFASNNTEAKRKIIKLIDKIIASLHDIQNNPTAE